MARGYQSRGFSPRTWIWMIFPLARAGRELWARQIGEAIWNGLIGRYATVT
jgi:hypothetical protein